MKKRKIAVAAVAAVAVVTLIVAGGYTMYSNKDNIDFGEIKVESIPEKGEGTTRVMSFNVRCADDPEGSINNRSQLVTAILDQYAPDSFGVQEATSKWLGKIDDALGDRYDRVGEARDFFGPFSEYSCVYYLKDKYNLIDSGTIWLSETPDEKYSVSFDSKCRRIATWAVLENKETGEKYTHLNTHLDHGLESTREAQAQVLLTKLNELQKEGTVVCTGDFNTDNESKVYADMTAVTDDTAVVAKNTQSGVTFHGYGKKTEGGPIDFIFVSKGIKALNYKIIDGKIKDMYPSDHNAICADIYLK